jgi:hypothetical protein
MFRRLAYDLLDRADDLITLAGLSVLDWLAGPIPETLIDRAIREQGERLRKALLKVDFDDPTPKPGLL